MKLTQANVYSLVLALAAAFLLTAPLAVSQTGGKPKDKTAKGGAKADKGKGEKAAPEEDLEDEEIEEDVVEDVEDEEDVEEEGEEGGGELELGKPGMEKGGQPDAGMISGSELAPPSFFTAPSAEEGEIEEEGGEEGAKKPPEEGKKEAKKEDKGKVVEEPAWQEKTSKFFEVTGYFRFRADLFYRLDMGFPADSLTGPFPVPFESRWDPEVQADYTSKVPCGIEGDHYGWCGKHLLTGANIRLRVEPVISLSEMVKIKAQFDVLDNLVLGTTPEGYYSQPGDLGLERVSRDPWVPIGAFAGTQVPPMWTNSLTSPISVRTAWGEVLLKNIGMIKFGRMPSQWGMGILANDGSCLDCNYGDIADRVMFATKLFDTVFGAGWDFPGSGPTSETFYNTQGQAYDVSVADDIYQWLLVIAYKQEKEEEEKRLALGKPVLAGGMYGLYRQQKLSAESDVPGASSVDIEFVHRKAWAVIGDLWFRFLMNDFRAELEWVMIGGQIGNLGLTSYTGESINVMQFGGALQLEQRFLDDRLAVNFEMGYASGDQNVEGMTPAEGLLYQNAGSGSTLMSREGYATAFRFDPDYNVDLILFEELLGQVSASYYFKPSVSYWFVKDHFFGQLDIIYSRASEFISTNGNNGNLGVEFDVSLKYKTKDRFTGILQYAYLIPLDAWKDLPGPEAYRDIKHPMTLQAMLAIEY
jgi:uncharacterized protein (TIGR04551 family)